MRIDLLKENPRSRVRGESGEFDASLDGDVDPTDSSEGGLKGERGYMAFRLGTLEAASVSIDRLGVTDDFLLCFLELPADEPSLVESSEAADARTWDPFAPV